MGMPSVIITMRNIMVPVFGYVSWRNIFDSIADPCSYLNRLILPVDFKKKPKKQWNPKKTPEVEASESYGMPVMLMRWSFTVIQRLLWKGQEVMQGEGFFWEKYLWTWGVAQFQSVSLFLWTQSSALVLDKSLSSVQRRTGFLSLVHKKHGSASPYCDSIITQCVLLMVLTAFVGCSFC